jgi:hypothetical protein
LYRTYRHAMFVNWINYYIFDIIDVRLLMSQPCSLGTSSLTRRIDHHHQSTKKTKLGISPSIASLFDPYQGCAL